MFGKNFPPSHVTPQARNRYRTNHRLLIVRPINYMSCRELESELVHVHVLNSTRISTNESVIRAGRLGEKVNCKFGLGRFQDYQRF